METIDQDVAPVGAFLLLVSSLRKVAKGDRTSAERAYF